MSYLSSLSGASRSPKSETGFFGASSLAHNAPLRPTNNDTAVYTPQRRPPSRRSQRDVPSPIKAAAILLAFLPIPPALSIIYIACGHVVLRAARPGDPAHFGAVPLISSVRAAAAGGAILALPLAILLYLLLFPTRPPDPEDFFDDEEDGNTLSTYGAYGACAVLLFVLGAISGALGTVCLPDNLMLSAAEAAEAGIVGGAIVCGGLAVLALVAGIVWWDFFRPKPGQSDPAFS